MSNKKKRNREIRERYSLIKEIEANPDLCFCEQINKSEPNIDFENEFIDSNNNVYYICKDCGKKYYFRIAFA